MEKLSERRVLGATGLEVPPVIFGTSALGNLYRALTYEEKRRIAEQWFENVAPPVVLDSAGKYGAGLALETLGRLLEDLSIPPGDVVISNKLGWKRVPLEGSEPTFERGAWVGIEHDAVQAISYRGIRECWEQGCELLGGRYRPGLASVHDPDEWLAAAEGPTDRSRRLDDLLEAYRALGELKHAGGISAVGIGAKDWTVIREVTDLIDLDWVMFACSFTVYTHPAELRELVSRLRERGVGIINSAVFNAGFLTGGEYFDYRKADPAADAPLFRWRERFLELCAAHQVVPSEACVEFGLSLPGIASIALNTGNPRHVPANVRSVTAKAPPEFWQQMKSAGLIDPAYPYLG